MRIGILTLHSALNYGAVLQTFASVRFLQSLGHEVWVVDYRNAYVSKCYHAFSWDSALFGEEGLMYLLKYPLRAFARLRRQLVFKRFVHRRLPLCPLSGAGELDLLLVGGDQVWNTQITGGKDPVYFGELFPSVRKAAWAASTGKTMPTRDEIQLLTKNFAAISVREESLAAVLPRSVVLPDPTLLLSPKEWKKIVHPVQGRYLLAYPMAFREEVVEVAQQKARELGLPLLVVSSALKSDASWIHAASPEDFLSLVCGAGYVVTSSFHGAVFSLLFERPHTFIYHDDPRFDTLLSTDRSRAAERAAAFLGDVM